VATTRMAQPLRIKCEGNEIPRVMSEQKTFHILTIVITRKDDLRIGGQLMDPINVIVQMNLIKIIVHAIPAWTKEESHKEDIQYPDGYLLARRPLGSPSKSTSNGPKSITKKTLNPLLKESNN